MNPLHASRFAAVAGIVLGAACAAATLPAGSPATGAARLGPASKQSALLYAFTIQGDAFIFSYPHGGLVKHFNVPGVAVGVWGVCADNSGDVFVTAEQSSTSSQIYEYAHGGTAPIATLPDDGFAAAGCSSDPTTGDLAVTNFDEASPGGANVAIYRNARGTPHRYVDPKMSVAYCGYDDDGNLFVDGSGDYQLAELTKGSRRFKNISLNEALVRPGGIAWDGTDVAIEYGGYARKLSAIDRVRVSGIAGTVVGTTHLKGLANRGVTFWIDGGKIVTVGGQQVDRVGLWEYPAGGKYLKLFYPTKTHRQTMYGVAVSAAQRR
jgi:hypothetical protein